MRLIRLENFGGDEDDDKQAGPPDRNGHTGLHTVDIRRRRFAQTAAFAQNANDGADGSLEEITVTGSRIKRSAEFDLPVPAQTLSARDMEVAGVNELSEAIAELPSITPDITSETSQSSTQSSGQSTISLRNLGSSRTLTLIDGRRTVGNTSTGQHDQPGYDSAGLHRARRGYYRRNLGRLRF